MSGEYKKGTGVLYVSGTELDLHSTTIIETMFDQQTDWELTELEFAKREVRNIKRLCIIKLLLAPIEMPLTLVLVGVAETWMKWMILKVSYSFMRGHINLLQFEEKLGKLTYTQRNTI